MTEDPSDPDGQEERLCEVLLHYLESSERGNRPDSAVFLARHPEIAPELKEFLETHDRLDGLTAPLRLQSQMNLQAAVAGSALTV